MLMPVPLYNLSRLSFSYIDQRLRAILSTLFTLKSRIYIPCGHSLGVNDYDRRDSSGLRSKAFQQRYTLSLCGFKRSEQYPITVLVIREDAQRA